MGKIRVYKNFIIYFVIFFDSLVALIRDMKVNGKELFTFKSRREADRMEESYSEHELEIMMQFYHICKRVIHDAE